MKPDSQAAALAFYMRAAGVQVTDVAVGTWLNLGTVLFLELAAALSVSVAAALRPMRGRSTDGARTRPEAPPAAAEGPDVPVKAETVAQHEKTGQSHDKDDESPTP